MHPCRIQPKGLRHFRTCSRLGPGSAELQTRKPQTWMPFGLYPRTKRTGQTDLYSFWRPRRPSGGFTLLVFWAVSDVSIQGLGYFRFPVSIRTIFTRCLRVRPVRYVEITRLTININWVSLHLDFGLQSPSPTLGEVIQFNTQQRSKVKAKRPRVPDCC